jgi:hypothetical protein
MKKKYEKPEMIIEVMSMDMLQMKCVNKSSLSRNATSLKCKCCIGTNYPVSSHF